MENERETERERERGGLRVRLPRECEPPSQVNGSRKSRGKIFCDSPVSGRRRPIKSSVRTKPSLRVAQAGTGWFPSSYPLLH